MRKTTFKLTLQSLNKCALLACDLMILIVYLGCRPVNYADVRKGGENFLEFILRPLSNSYFNFSKVNNISYAES